MASPKFESLLLDAICKHDVACVQSLIESRSHFDTMYFGISILHYAAAQGNVEVVRILLTDERILRNINTFDDISATPLIEAVRAGNAQTVKLLIDSGADVNLHDINKSGNTALREAVELKNATIIRILLAAGANPSIPGWMGVSALRKAQIQYNIDPSPDNATIISMLSEI